MVETLTEIQKHKEDIQILLSTLEEAYREASITEEHYNEVKGKNQKKLEELNKKIEMLEKAAARNAGKEGKREPAKKPEKARKPGKARKAKEPEPGPAPVSTPAVPSPTPPVPAETALPAPAAPESESAGYSGIPQPLTDIAGEGEVKEVKPEKAPGAARGGESGTLRYTADEIKEMLTKILKEIKPQGIEVAPRVDKLEVHLEKVRAYLDSMKDERSTGREGMQRLTEEVGEIRSNVSGLDRRLSESEIKVTGVDEALGDMRPQRFLKAMREEDASIKLHEARLDKLDDMTSLMLKKLGQIEEVLKRLGSLEKIVNFSKEAAKRLLEIENREKRISRIADKIDGIFMELNKRLDEFLLYKAKQDTLDELSQEMMKSLDELNTKIQKYAEKSDLDLFRDTIETELASIRTGAGTSPEVQKLEAQKTEIEGLIAMLDEQFKAGALPEKEYKKTKQINMDRLKDIEKKISGATLGAQSPQEWAEKATAPSGEAAKAGEPGPAKTGEANPPEVQSTKAPPTSEKPAEQKPEAKPSPGTPTKPEKMPGDKQEGLLSHLEDSLMRGLIGRKAYEKAKKLIPRKKSGGRYRSEKGQQDGDKKE